MNIIYVDYENVRESWISEIDNIDKNWKIYIIAGENDILHISNLEKLIETGVKFEVFTVKTGCKDALDFQLVVHLIAKYKKDNMYYIVSKDKGYEFAIEMAKKLGKENIERCDSVLEVIESYKKLKEIDVVSKDSDIDIAVIAPMIVGNILQG